MKENGKSVWLAAAILAAALAVWILSAGGFRAALSAAFPAAPAFEAGTAADPAIVPAPVSVAATATAATPTPPGACAVARIVDGDTIRVLCAGGVEEPVRLVGVDAPEVARQGNPAECGGHAATAALSAALAGGEVFLASDPEQSDRDRYGRLLRFVATSSPPTDLAAPWEGSVNVWLVQSGAATAYRGIRYGGTAAFLAAEGLAREIPAGLWESCPQS